MPGLDILRGVAIALVLVYHGMDGRLPWPALSGPWRYIFYATSWGATGVHLFFVLSGFLITGILIDSRETNGYWRRFYTNRALRILPAYLLMLAVLKISNVISWRFLVAAVFYAANMARLFGARNAEYGSLWSLAVEEQFYLLWPVVVRRCSLRTLRNIAISVIAASPGVFLLITSISHSVDSYYKLWGNACWLLAGGLVSVSLRGGALHIGNIHKWIHGLTLAGVFAGSIVVYSELRADLPGWAGAVIQPIARFPVVALYIALLLLIISNNSRIGQRRYGFAVGKTAAFLGYISYGLYLVHSFVFTELDRYVASTYLAVYRDRIWWTLATTVVYSLVSIAIAYVSRRYFEELFLRFKPK